MRPGERFRLLLLILVILTAALIAIASPLVRQPQEEETTQREVQFVRPVDNGSAQLWPYTSRRSSFDEATLPINVIVHDDAATVYSLLVFDPNAGESLYWQTTSEAWTVGRPSEGNVTITGTGIQWGESAGAERYTFILTRDGGRWTPATFQIHHGAYFGSRYHLRLYRGESGDRAWTAIQAHHEYWDWFRLRHDVNSLTRAKQFVERDFLETNLVADMRRERWGNGGAIDADGWVTIIELDDRVTRGPEPTTAESRPTHPPLVLPLLGMAIGAALQRLLAAVRDIGDRFRQSQVQPPAVALFASTAILPVVVRIGAIAVERAFPLASPMAVGGGFYLLLVIGLPVSAGIFGRGLSTTEGFGISVLGMGTGIMIDYAYLGLAAIPFGALVHRVFLLFGLGLIGASGTRWSTKSLPRHRYLLAGIVIWVSMLIWPLVRF